jgi:hypothetical protein
MAEISIAATEVGAYELVLPAGKPVSVQVQANGNVLLSSVVLTAHSGADPIYFTVDGTTPAPKSPTSLMIPVGMYREVPTRVDEKTPLKLVSASDAVVSLARS